MSFPITVVLPIYNGEAYLQESIDSALKQDLDFELHVLDDMSSDGSAEIAQSAADRRVRYSRNPGRFGLFKTLNRGFAEAKSSCVKIWAQDDVMNSGALSAFYTFAEEHADAGLVFSRFITIDEKGTPTYGEERYPDQYQRIPAIAGPRQAALLFLCFGCLPGNISTVLLRREAWSKAGGFLEGAQQAPDYDMWLRISAFAPIAFIPEKLVALRDHPEQLSRTGHREASTIREEHHVYAQFAERLRGVLTEDELAKFWRQHRGIQHAHWIVRALLRLDITHAREGLRALGLYGGTLIQLLSWALSVNGRFFTRSAAEFFDKKFPLLDTR